MANIENIPFIKMQATGNDFVVLDNLKATFSPEEVVELSPVLCHRKYGVGADGLMALQKPKLPDTDYEMLYRNADGSDAGMCGNGSRCLALLASQLGMGKNLTFSVHQEIYSAQVLNKNNNLIVITFPISAKVKEITIANEQLWQIFTGTDHVVKEVPKERLQQEEKLVQEGRHLRTHEQFQPTGTNANFFCGLNEQSIQVQTYERGVENLTLACGTGAIASAIAWHHKQQLNTRQNEFNVKTKGGDIGVEFEFNPADVSYSNIKLTGPAHFVFEGTYYV